MGGSRPPLCCTGQIEATTLCGEGPKGLRSGDNSHSWGYPYLGAPLAEAEPLHAPKLSESQGRAAAGKGRAARAAVRCSPAGRCDPMGQQTQSHAGPHTAPTLLQLN